MDVHPKRKSERITVGIIKGIILVIPVYLLVSIVNRQVFFTPHLVFSYHPGQKPLTLVPTNLAAVVKTGDVTLPWRLTSDAFPFTVGFPRLVKTVHVTGKLQNRNQPYISFTAHGNELVGDMRTTVYSEFLEKLGWKHVADHGLTLWMKDARPGNKASSNVREYSSIQDFISNPPPADQVGSIGVNPLLLTHVDNYQPDASMLSLGHNFRGSHQIMFYAANETIRIQFDVLDLNWAAGPDNVAVRIGRAEDLTDRNRTWITTRTIRDDGITNGSKQRKQLRPVVIEIPNAQPGIYVLEISTTDDVLLTNFRSQQHRIAFANRVYLADGPVYNGGASFPSTEIIAQAPRVTFAADHDQGKQTIQVNGKSYVLQKSRVPVTSENLGNGTTFTIDKGDIVVSGNGLFTLRPADMIDDTGMRPLALDIKPDVSNLNYILAEYAMRGTSPTITFSETYTLSDLDISKKRLSFSINAPGLHSTDALLGLKNIRVTFDRGEFPWSKLWKKLQR